MVLLDNADGTGSTLLENAYSPDAHCPKASPTDLKLTFKQGFPYRRINKLILLVYMVTTNKGMLHLPSNATTYIRGNVMTVFNHLIGDGVTMVWIKD